MGEDSGIGEHSIVERGSNGFYAGYGQVWIKTIGMASTNFFLVMLIIGVMTYFGISNKWQHDDLIVALRQNQEAIDAFRDVADDLSLGALLTEEQKGKLPDMMKEKLQKRMERKAARLAERVER